MLREFMCTLLRNLTNDSQFYEMSKLQNDEILDKIEELIAVMQNGFKTLYTALLIIILIASVGIGMAIIASVIFLSR